MIDRSATQKALRKAGYSPGPTDDGIFGALTYKALLSAAAGRDLGADGVKYGQICSAMIPKYGIDQTPWRLQQWLARTAHETTNYTAFAESLYYTTPARLVKMWPSRFNLVTAVAYLRNERKLAEKVYGGRYGNPPGKAYDYRGGGWIQTTFLDNYAAAQKATGLPLVEHPELLHDPLTGIEPACAFWQAKGCNQLADDDHTGRSTSIRVNGGTNGLMDTMAKVTTLSRLVRG